MLRDRTKTHIHTHTHTQLHPGIQPTEAEMSKEPPKF